MAQSTRVVVLHVLFNMNVRAIRLKNGLILAYKMGHTATYCPRVINTVLWLINLISSFGGYLDKQQSDGTVKSMIIRIPYLLSNR